MKDQRSTKETERTSDDVIEERGRLYVLCNCGWRSYLGLWGAAHA